MKVVGMGVQQSSRVEAQGQVIDLIDAVAADTEVLFLLDEFYTLLFALIMVYDHEPDYLGNADEATIMNGIEKILQNFRPDQQTILKSETGSVEALLNDNEFQQARQRVYRGAGIVMDYIADGREPPEYLKPFLKDFPEDDLDTAD